MLFPPGFDQAIAQEAASLVKAAYDQYKNPTWDLGPGYQELGSLSADGERFGFVALNLATQNAFVVFRGTATLIDWLADLSFPQVAHPWGMVEDGFSRVYAQCSVSVITAVKRVPGAPIFVTGHSLEAGLATLATADLAIHGIAAAMYNIASPRVGNAAFTSAFNANSQVLARWRIANTEDIVTTVPLATPNLAGVLPATSRFALALFLMHKLDYTHVGTAVNFTVNNGSIVGNHAIETYIAALATT
jgi:triacylglycerol lipase